MGLYSTVACSEIADSFNENIDLLSGMTFSVDLHCAWEDRIDLMADILENSNPYPKFTSFNVYPISCGARMEPQQTFGAASGQEIDYTDALARVTVTYSTATGDIASESLEPFTNFQTLDHRFFRFTNGNTGRLLMPQEAPAQLQMGLNIMRSRYRLSSVPADVLTCLGCVNSGTYTSSILGLTFAPETLLFQPQNVLQSFSTFTVAGFTLVEKFSYNPNGWNTYWNSFTSTFESIYYAGAGASRYIQYPLASFSGLTV